jgi:hypothetical protein
MFCNNTDSDIQSMRQAASHDFFGNLLQTGRPLQTSTEAAFANHQSRLPPAQRAAFEFPDTADASAILDEVFGKSSVDNPDRVSALEALHDSEASARVRNLPGILTAAECSILREKCDLSMASAQAGGSRDNVDGLPDFQINLDRRELANLLNNGSADGSSDIVNRLCAAENDWFGGKDWARIGMFVRRYSPSTRPWFPFHTDSNAYTANVALSKSTDHQGGSLLCLVGGAVRACDRRLGVATVHSGDVLHAVTPVTAGVRYSLLIFFHGPKSTNITASVAEKCRIDAPLARHPGIQEM